MYEDIKERMAEICRRFWQRGLSAANDGNISVKVEDNLFLATQTGVSKADTTAENIGLIDKELNIIEAPTPDWRPSSEMRLHMCCYRERPEIGSVVHAHPPIATGFACSGAKLDTYCTIEGVLELGAVPVVPYAKPSTDELAESVVPFIKDHDAILLANHGAVTLGKDLNAAYFRMETLEHQAHIALVARLLGGSKDIAPANIAALVEMRPQYGL